MNAEQLDLLDLIAASLPRGDTTIFPRGSRQKADWLADQIDGGAITRRAAADAIGIDPADLDPILSGRVTISGAAWRKIAALAAPGA